MECLSVQAEPKSISPGDPGWVAPASVEEARTRASAAWEAIQRINLQLEDRSRSRLMTGEDYARWVYRAKHARLMKMSELRALRQYLAEHGVQFARGRYREIVATATEVVALYEEGARGELLSAAIRALKDALQEPGEGTNGGPEQEESDRAG